MIPNNKGDNTMGLKKTTKGKLTTFNRAIVVNTNDMINLTYLPSKSCYASKIAGDIETKLKYIQARVRESHESVIEHAYVCLLLSIKKDDAADFVQVANGFRYLNVETTMDETHIYILIGGGLRAYKHLIRETLDQTNRIIFMVKDCLYSCSYQAFFIDLINGGAMRPSFIDAIDEDTVPCIPLKTSDEDRVEILNIDSIQTIYDTVKKYGFAMEQCLSMASITILFKDMSRVITQQLTRHRNAITQESQRYVNYSNTKFNDPTKFKPEKYADKEDCYTVNALGTTISASTQHLGDELCSIYSQLVDQGMEKEDARGYLPQNNQSSKVYMTFTYRTLLQFLKLRTDSHAQAEIRQYANIIDEALRAYLKDNAPSFMEDIYYYTIPRYMKTEDESYATYIKLDEVLEVTESTETVELPVEPNEKENAELLKAELNTYDPNRYAYTRQDEKVIKEAASGRKDV